MFDFKPYVQEMSDTEPITHLHAVPVRQALRTKVA